MYIMDWIFKPLHTDLTGVKIVVFRCVSILDMSLGKDF